MKKYRIIENKKASWSSLYGFPKKVQVRKFLFFWKTIGYFPNDKNAEKANLYMKDAERRGIK